MRSYGAGLGRCTTGWVRSPTDERVLEGRTTARTTVFELDRDAVRARVISEPPWRPFEESDGQRLANVHHCTSGPTSSRTRC
jgi:hypothetical protein